MRDQSQARSVLLLGSVPLGSAAEVFETVAGVLGDLAPRIPDGETGERLGWIAWTRDHFRRLNSLEPLGERGVPGPRFRLRDPAAGKIDLGALQYAPVAIRSYAQFRQLKQQGKVPAATRFQVSLPTPFGIVFGLFPASELATTWRLFEERMRAEIAEIARAVPAEELAIQWDIAVETIGVLEDSDNATGLTATDVAGSIARMSNAIPEAIELGLHICYGDRDHKHFIEPRDLAVATAFANLLSRTIRRPISWVHMPVPRDRADAPYFAPLASLALGPGTQLYLGLVHLSDGVDGARHRMTAANRFVNAYGIATEFGLGRRPAETIPAILALHRDVAALND